MVHGLRVQVARVPWQRGTHAVLRVAAGYGDDPGSSPGLAHLCEHERLAHAALLVPDDTVRHNGRTDAAETVFQVATPGEEWPTAIARALALLAPGGLAAGRLDAERSAVLIEMERAAGRPTMRLGPLVAASAMPGEDLARLGEATRDTVRAATAGDVSAFLDRFYLPRHATLTVTTPVSGDELLEHVLLGHHSLRHTSPEHVAGRPDPFLAPAGPAAGPAAGAGTIAPVPELTGTLAATLAATRPDRALDPVTAIALAALTDPDGVLDSASPAHRQRVTGATTLTGRQLDLTVLSWGTHGGAGLIAGLARLVATGPRCSDERLALTRRRLAATHGFAQQTAAGLADQLSRWFATGRSAPLTLAGYGTTPLPRIRHEMNRLLASMRLWRIEDGQPRSIEVT